MKARIQHETGIEPRYMDIFTLAGYLSIGQSNARKIGKESGAELKFGRRTLYEKAKIDKYFDELSKG